MPDPTAEQTAALDTFIRGQHLVLQAGAGTGKTTTLRMLANSTPARGLYLAFNRSIADEAQRTFPRTVACRTSHSLAWNAVGRYFRGRMNQPRLPSWKIGRSLGINQPLRVGAREVSDKALSYAAIQTVTQYCYSSDQHVNRWHVPRLRGAEADEHHDQIVDVVLPYARKAWRDLQHPDHGHMRFLHDHYVKMWALTEPRLAYDFLLLDEAQDTNPVLEEVFLAQRGHAQLVMVGDSAQAIYGWRGAQDVMRDFDGTQLILSQSFRFGPTLAAEANRWLRIAGARLRLTGTDSLPTTLGPTDTPDVILCRSNYGAMAEVMDQLAAGKRVCLIGGSTVLKNLALAARDLKAGRRSSHPDLMLFETWGELQEYANDDPAGHDLLTLVDLVDEHGTDTILDSVDLLHDEAQAEVSVSTAHKAKGREWGSVRVAADFEEPEPGEDAQGRPVPGQVRREEARLAYVAITRARHRLDLGGLTWIETHPAGGTTGPPSGHRQS